MNYSDAAEIRFSRIRETGRRMLFPEEDMPDEENKENEAPIQK